jgi:surface antigen
VASLRLAIALTLALGLGVSLGGCAVSGSMFSKHGKDEARAEALDDVTGSVGTPAVIPASASTAALPPETDLVFARMAIVDVLQRGSKEISTPWENSSSGAHGTVTPIASAYSKDGLNCRNVLASYVRRQGSETWLQGEACRPKAGPWEVKSLRPWSRS